MKLYIFGASGSGVTTLGKALSEKLNYTYFDSDDYLWEATTPPYTTKRDKQQRNAMLETDMKSTDNCILGGSIVSWNSNCPELFDLAVFLYLPTEIRLDRIKKREIKRFGDVLVSNPERKKQFDDLVQWAAGYDNDKECGRGLPIHENWIENAPCPVLELRTNLSVEDRMKIVIEKMAGLNPQ